MRYINLTKVIDLPFEQYLQVKVDSFSSLKQKGKSDFIPTKKVYIGKLVDDILTNKGLESNLLNPLYSIAKDIADRMRSDLGEQIFKFLQFQNSYFGDIEFEGFRLSVKGRLDAEIGKKAIVDFKVTDLVKNKEDCLKLVQFMGYERQLFHYGNLAGGNRAHYLFIYSKKARKTFFLKVLTTEDSIASCRNWWEERVLTYGKLIN